MSKNQKIKKKKKLIHMSHGLKYTCLKGKYWIKIDAYLCTIHTHAFVYKLRSKKQSYTSDKKNNKQVLI